MAEAFFRFDTDIKATQAAIRSGLAAIEADLRRGRSGGGGSMFDGFAKAANKAVQEARAEVAKLGEGNFQAITRGSQSGGGKEIAAEYRKIEKQALAEAKKAVQEAARSAGVSTRDIGVTKAVTDVQTAMRDQLRAMRDLINDKLGKELGLTSAQFSRRSRAEVAGVQPATGSTQPTKGKEAGKQLTTLGRTDANARIGGEFGTSLVGRAQEQSKGGRAAKGRLDRIEFEAYRIADSRLGNTKDTELKAERADKDFNKAESLRARRAAVALRRETRLLRLEEGGAQAAIQRATSREVRSNPRTRNLAGGAKELDGEVYAGRGAGMSKVNETRAAAALERDATQARTDSDRAQDKLNKRRAADEKKQLADARRLGQERQAADDRADPTFRELGRGRYTTSTGVFSRTRAGSVEELNPDRQLQARVEQEANQRKREQKQASVGRHASLTQSFIGGATSSGFGGSAVGFDPSGLARSFGSTVKFSAQYQALNLVTQAFTDTIAEAVDYRDSLTDLNLALGEGEKASAGYVDGLSNISKLAGGNVGQALDAAARGVRAFTDEADSASQKTAAGETSARLATELSIITGQTIPDAMGDVVAIGQSFGLGLNELGRVSDAVAAAKAQGGNPLQIAQGLANASVALNAAGFDAAESAQLISAVIANLNESGQAAATRISRIVSAAASSSGRTLFRSLNIDPDQGAKESLLALANTDLSKSDLQRSLSTLGGGSNLREFKATLDVLRKDVDGFTNGFDTAGAAQVEVDRKTSDLAGTLKVLAGTLANVQNEIFDSGAFAPFLAALATIQPVLSTVEALLKAFNRLSEVVLPDFEIGGVGAQEVLVGAVEILLITKALQAVRRRGAVDTTRLIGLEVELATANAAVAKATQLAATGEQTALVAHKATVLAIEQEIAALSGLTVARQRSGTAAFGSIGASRTGRAANAVGAGVGAGTSKAKTFLGTTAGMATGGLIAVVAATQAVLALKGALDENRRSIASGRDAINALGAGAPGDTVEELRSAAAERGKASSGITGNIVDFFSKAPQKLGLDKRTFGVDAELDQKNLNAEASAEQARVDRRREREAEASKGTGRFTNVFNDITSVDALTAGLAELDASGASATRQVQLVAEAFAGLASTEQPGLVAPGGAAQVGEDFANTIFGSLEEALAKTGKDPFLFGLEPKGDQRDSLLGSALNGNAPRSLEKLAVDEEIARLNDDRRKAKIPQLNKDDEKDREVALEGLRNARRRELARKTINENTPRLAVGNRNDIEDEAAGKLSDFISAKIGNGGGVLTPALITEAATMLADFMIGSDASLQSSRTELVAKYKATLTEQTTLKRKDVNQDVSNFLQTFAIGASAKSGGEQAALTGDATLGAQAKVAVLGEAIAFSESIGREINDDILAAKALADLELVASLQDKAKVLDDLAKAQLGSDDVLGAASIDLVAATRVYADALKGNNQQDVAKALGGVLTATERRSDALRAVADARDEAGVDPRSTIGGAAVGVRGAQRALAAAREGTAEFYKAQSALQKAQQGYADEVLEASVVALYNGIHPQDTLAQANAAVEEGRLRLAALRKQLPAPSGLNDFDTQGNPVGNVDPLAKGTGVGKLTLDGVLRAPWATTGERGAKLLLDKFAGTFAGGFASILGLMTGVDQPAGVNTGVPGGAGVVVPATATTAAARQTIYPSDYKGIVPIPYTNSSLPTSVLAGKAPYRDGEGASMFPGLSVEQIQALQKKYQAEQAAIAKAKAAQGATTRPPAANGIPAASGASDTRNVLKYLGAASGLSPVVTPNGENTGKHAPNSNHYKNQAIDFGFAGNDPAKLRALAEYLYKNYKSQLAELIFEDPRDGTRFGVKNGQDLDFGDKTFAGHRKHVHTALKPSGATALSGQQPGSAQSGQGATLPLSGEDRQKQIDTQNQENARTEFNRVQTIQAIDIARLQSKTDPNNSLDQARANVRIAKRKVRDALAGTADYYGAVTEQNQAELAFSQALAARVGAQDNAAAAKKGSDVARAAAGLRIAAATLKNQAPRTKEYYEALGAHFEAQRAYADAVRAAAGVSLQLSSDITNPVAQATIAVRLAERKRREVRKSGGDQAAIEAADLEARNAVVALEQAAFDRRFSRASTDAELGRTSQASYLAFLKSEETRLGAIANRTDQQQNQYDQVQRTLQGLNKQLSGQFNLGDIKIPTPFEVRRSIAERVAEQGAAAAGSGLNAPFKRFGLPGGATDPAASATTLQTVNVVINGNDTNAMKAVLSQYLGASAFQRTSVSNTKI